MSKKAPVTPTPAATHFEIFHWVPAIKDLEPTHPHRSLRPVEEYFAVAEQLHKLGYYVMLHPEKAYLAVDTRTFSQR